MGSVAVAPEFDAVDIEHDIKVLNGLALKLRGQRYKTGYLGVGSLRLSFTLDENGLPTDTDSYAIYDAHKLIEEVYIASCFMNRKPLIPIYCAVHAPR